MSDTETYPLLHFREPFESVAWEVSAKGYYGGVLVELEDGSRYLVFFYDSVRLSQDLQAESKSGRPFIAEAGMIVVPEISEANMRLAVRQLHKENWFNHLQPIVSA